MNNNKSFNISKVWTCCNYLLQVYVAYIGKRESDLLKSVAFKIGFKIYNRIMVKVYLNCKRNRLFFERVKYIKDGHSSSFIILDNFKALKGRSPLPMVAGHRDIAEDHLQSPERA